MTCLFENLKNAGRIENGGKCEFKDGLKWHRRTLWKDKITGDMYVVFNYNAYSFRLYPYREQPNYDGYFIGFKK